MEHSTEEGVSTRIANMTKDEIAGIAYAAVEDLEWLEPNDGNRLGYHIYLYLNGNIGSIEEALLESQSRTSLAYQELIVLIRERLRVAGIDAK